MHVPVNNHVVGHMRVLPWTDCFTFLLHVFRSQILLISILLSRNPKAVASLAGAALASRALPRSLLSYILEARNTQQLQRSLLASWDVACDRTLALATHSSSYRTCFEHLCSERRSVKCQWCHPHQPAVPSSGWASLLTAVYPSWSVSLPIRIPCFRTKRTVVLVTGRSFCLLPSSMVSVFLVQLCCLKASRFQHCSECGALFASSAAASLIWNKEISFVTFFFFKPFVISKVSNTLYKWEVSRGTCRREMRWEGRGRWWGLEPTQLPGLSQCCRSRRRLEWVLLLEWWSVVSWLCWLFQRLLLWLCHLLSVSFDYVCLQRPSLSFTWCHNTTVETWRSSPPTQSKKTRM